MYIGSSNPHCYDMAADILVKLVQDWKSVPDSSRKKSVLLTNIILMGRTAAFFGGYDAMIKLYDAAEKRVGDNNSVGYWLNYMWDSIGGWSA